MKEDNTKLIAEKFADGFQNEVDKTVHCCDVILLKEAYKTNVANTMFVAEVTDDEILRILKNLNGNKGAGADRIRPKDLKQNAELLTPTITKLINLCLTNGKIPDKLKTAIVRPIFKKGNKSEYENYRPISILSTIEKILEEVVVTRITSYIRKLNIINSNQYGFQKTKNINQLLGNFSNFLNKSMSSNTYSVVLFIDFTKAFDTIPHKKLVECLKNIGIRGNFLNLLADYLKNRTFETRIGNSFSTKKPLKYGVPQGSKLGPLMFILCANDLLKQFKHEHIFAYAEDTAVAVSHKNLRDAIKAIH